MTLNDSDRVCIIGAQRRNVSAAQWEHPAFLFRDGTSVVRHGLPPSTKVLVFTRFTKHHVFYALTAEAKRRGITIIPGLTSTGRLKTLLEQFTFPIRPTKQKEGSMTATIQTEMSNRSTTPVTVTEPPPRLVRRRTPTAPRRRYPRQYLSTLIRQHASRVHEKTFVEDMVALAAAEGVAVTRKQVYMARYHILAAGTLQGLKGRQTAASAAQTVTPPRHDAASDAVQLLDNAIAAIQLVREKVEQDRSTRLQVEAALRNLL